MAKRKIKPSNGQKKRGRLKLVWAMEDLYSSGVLDRSCLDVLRALNSRLELDVIPVHVIEPSLLDLSVDFRVNHLKEMENEALSNLRLRIDELGLGEVRAPRVLLHMPGAGPGAIQLLTGFARAENADVLLACTRANTGHLRFVAGSFTENIMAHSSIPVLVVSPNTRVGGEFDEIIFPTDFSSDCEVAFPGAVDLAAKLGARLLVFFQESESASAESMGPAADQLLKLAASRGVDCVYHANTLEGRRPVSVSDAILEFSERSQPGRRRLIVITTHACPLSPKLGNSVARQLVERSVRPVWVIHGHQSVLIGEGGGISGARIAALR